MSRQQYLQQLAQVRHSREQQQHVQYLNELHQEINDAELCRDEAFKEAQKFRKIGDVERAVEIENEAWEYDARAQEARKDYHRNAPPPQNPPAWDNWMRKHAAFIERAGKVGEQAVQATIAYMMRPRNPNGTTDPTKTGMGMTPEQIFTPQGLEQLDTIMHTAAKPIFNVEFDSAEQGVPTPGDVAKFSGSGAKNYNAASQKIYQMGMMESQKRR